MKIVRKTYKENISYHFHGINTAGSTAAWPQTWQCAHEPAQDPVNCPSLFPGPGLDGDMTVRTDHLLRLVTKLGRVNMVVLCHCHVLSLNDRLGPELSCANVNVDQRVGNLGI